jgi:hypothetical protein
MTRARDLASLGDNTTKLEQAGLIQVIPSSITVAGVGSSGSVASNGTVTFSTCTSVAFNYVFSSTYKSYQIILLTNSATSIWTYNLKLRTSSTATDKSADYYWSGQYQKWDTTAEGGENGNNTTSFQIGGLGPTRGSVNLTIHNPYESQETNFSAIGHDGEYKRIYAGKLGVTTSYDGFTLSSGGSNLTGSVNIYGFNY